MKTIVSLSGGKDSTAMLHLMIEKGIHFDEVIFSDTTVEFPQMYEHLNLIEKKTGVKITRVEPEHDFYYYLTQIERTHNRSKIREHLKGYGFAGAKSRWCTHQFKIANPRKYLREKYGKEPIMHCVGIAADELHRVKDDPLIRYPLIEYGITEEKALNLCRSLGYTWGGLYDLFDRVSCWCCPLQGLDDLATLKKHFPELWEKLKEWDRETFNQFRPGYK